jgi:NO-binding membrane sensor protein with MHYT domain
VAEISHFEYGWTTPALSYALSVLGSFLGLLCAVRARQVTSGGQRVWWLSLAAWALGGTAIWTMHFMAMLGFGVSGTQLRYNVPITAASAVLAIVTVGIGLFIVGLGTFSTTRIVIAGVFTGFGVAAMHYTGMAAMRLDGEIDYAPGLVGLSIGIAVVAATAAFWLAMTVHGGWAIAGSALVMGIAVCGMHYTGMSAVSVHLHGTATNIEGATASALLVPILLTVIFVVIALIYAVLAAPDEEDRAAAAYLNARLAERA